MCIFFVRDVVDVVVVVAATKQASRVSGQSPNPISRNVTMIGPILSCASGHRVPGRYTSTVYLHPTAKSTLVAKDTDENETKTN